MATNIKTVMTYPIDGSQTDFAIPFEYLARKFVQVTLIGVDRKILVLNQDYRFATKAIISTTKAWGPADGYQQLEIRRYTSATERLVDFTDGSILRAYDLNISQIQTLHVAEEARDLTADTIGVNNDGNLDARGRRIVNLADGVSDGDAISVGQVKRMNQNSWQARNESLQFRNEAEGFRNQAASSQQTAAASELQSWNHSERSRGFSEHSEVMANESARHAYNANTSETNAKTSETNSKTSETNSKTSEINAKTSETNAKRDADAAQAALMSTGNVPVGTVAMIPHTKIPVGWVRMGDTFDVNTYPALAALFPDGKTPSMDDRYVLGHSSTTGAPGTLIDQALPPHQHTVGSAIAVSGQTSDNGYAYVETADNGWHEHDLVLDFSSDQSGAFNGYLAGSRGAVMYPSQMTKKVNGGGQHRHGLYLPNHNHSVYSTGRFDTVSGLTGIGTGPYLRPYSTVMIYIIKAAQGVDDKDAAMQVVGTVVSRVDALESWKNTKGKVVDWIEPQKNDGTPSDNGRYDRLTGIGLNTYTTVSGSSWGEIVSLIRGYNQIQGAPGKISFHFGFDLPSVDDLIGKAGIYPFSGVAVVHFQNGSNANDLMRCPVTVSGHAFNGWELRMGVRLAYGAAGAQPVIDWGFFKDGAGVSNATAMMTARVKVIMTM